MNYYYSGKRTQCYLIVQQLDNIIKKVILKKKQIKGYSREITMEQTKSMKINISINCKGFIYELSKALDIKN